MLLPSGEKLASVSIDMFLVSLLRLFDLKLYKYISLFPCLEIVSAILYPLGWNVGEDAIPSNFGNLIGIVFKKGVITKTSDLLFLKDT